MVIFFNSNEKKTIKFLTNWMNSKKMDIDGKKNHFSGFTFEHGIIGLSDMDLVGIGAVLLGTPNITNRELLGPAYKEEGWQNTKDNWILVTAPWRYNKELGVWVGGEQTRFKTNLDGKEGVKQTEKLIEWMLNPVDTVN